ncbi:hypothetical protein TNCV_2123911 [Trichonephila clavipes]|nr:hypothetical protein TNCV_2123911 [Trichonephila clavipes]
MRVYDFDIQKIYRLQLGSNAQSWADDVGTLSHSHRADVVMITNLWLACRKFELCATDDLSCRRADVL